VKKDTEIRLYLQERKKGMTQRVAAARAGIGERTARKYERAGALPSQRKRRHEWKTRIDPFEEDWPWVVGELERDPALQGSTLFALLCERHPGRYRSTQVRTLQRHIQQWRVLHGPEREVMFAQQHVPGERGQSDFTHMKDLAVTLVGHPFAHLLHHLVLTYSNVEAVSICFSESFEALAEGIEHALWQLGGVPAQHRTDHLTAAIQEARERLHIVPADKDLNTAANHIVASGMKSYYILRNAMKQLQGYDYILFDHSPSYSPITESALLASQEMLIPCELASFAVQGLLNMLEKLNATLSDLDHELDLCGIVPFKLDMRYSMSHQYLESLKATFGEKILQPIRTDATVPRSQSIQETVFEYDHRSKVAEDFSQLAVFVMQKGQQEVKV
jgi:cellulose biosynthesis protein BcsQ